MTHSTLRMVIAVIVCAAPAAADRASMEAGLKAFEALDYERAVAFLQQAFSESLDVEEKRTVLRTLAFAHVALNDDDQARAEFRLLLRIDPQVTLDETISPRTRLVFEEARAEVGHALALLPRPSPEPVVAPALPPSPEPRALIEPPRPSPRPLYRRGWIWGTAAGATAAVILIGVLAGVYAEPSTARITVAHP
jgi:tetratricopeptide (TPR) repeat protein